MTTTRAATGGTPPPPPASRTLHDNDGSDSDGATHVVPCRTRPRWRRRRRQGLRRGGTLPRPPRAVHAPTTMGLMRRVPRRGGAMRALSDEHGSDGESSAMGPPAHAVPCRAHPRRQRQRHGLRRRHSATATGSLTTQSLPRAPLTTTTETRALTEGTPDQRRPRAPTQSPPMQPRAPLTTTMTTTWRTSPTQLRAARLAARATNRRRRSANAALIPSVPSTMTVAEAAAGTLPTQQVRN